MFSRQALWPRAQANQLLPKPDAPVTSKLRRSAIQSQSGELEEERAVEPARTLIVDVLDAGWMTQLGDPGARFELLLPAQREFVFEQQPEPFGMIEAARFRFVFEFLEPFGQAVEAEGVQLVECRMSEHGDFSQW